MENTEIFKITFWIATITTFVLSVGVLLLLQHIYHKMIFKINEEITNSLSEYLQNTDTQKNETGEYIVPDTANTLQESKELSDDLPENTSENPSTIRFTKRENEVFLLSLEEYTSQEIAHKLNIELKTVERHRENMMRKTDSKKFIGVIRYVLSNHILPVDELKKLKKS